MPAVDSAARGTDLCSTLALSEETATLPSSSCEAAELTVLHHRLADPIDAWVVTDALVVGVDHDDLLNSVRAQNSPEFQKIPIFAWILIFGALVENVFSPKGWQKNS